MNNFQHASIQIGDKAFYTVKYQDISNSLDQENNSSSSSPSKIPPKEGTNAGQIEVTEGTNAGQIEAKEGTSAGQIEVTEGMENTVPNSQIEDPEMKLWTVTSADQTSVGTSAMEGVDVSNSNVQSQSKAPSSTACVAVQSGGGKDQTKCAADSKTEGTEAPVCELEVNRAEGGCTVEKTGKGDMVRSDIQTSGENNGTRAGAGTDVGEPQPEEEHHARISDSGDADEDSDGADTVVPKTKGAGSGVQKHDPLPASVRYPVKRRKKRTRRKRKAVPQMKVKAGDKVCIEVVSTYTTVDVIWQDGSKTKALLSTDLVPVFHLDELEFFPGDFVTDKRGNRKCNKAGWQHQCN